MFKYKIAVLQSKLLSVWKSHFFSLKNTDGVRLALTSITAFEFNLSKIGNMYLKYVSQFILWLL